MRWVTRKKKPALVTAYDSVLADLVRVIEQARSTAARSVNTVMTATNWEMGRRIVEHEQGGRIRAGYGEELLARLATNLTKRYQRGSPSTVWRRRASST